MCWLVIRKSSYVNLGQFAKYLKSKFPEFNYLQVNKVAGLPFTVVELKEKINKII